MENLHRVIPGFMIQGGCPEEPVWVSRIPIKGEFAQNGFANDLKHTPGVLSMARAMHPDSAGSQFFIMHETSLIWMVLMQPSVRSQKVLMSLTKSPVPTDFRDRPLEDQVIATIVIDTLGETYPEPVTV